MDTIIDYKAEIERLEQIKIPYYNKLKSTLDSILKQKFGKNDDQDNAEKARVLKINLTDEYVNSLKLAELKQLILDLNSVHGKVKALKMGVSGNKDKLRMKIFDFMRKIECVKTIQTNWRMHIVAKFWQLHGKTAPSVCVNTDDFYSLEPLDKIDKELFFSFTDEDNYTYGFDIISLLNYFKQNNGKLVNPYNRKKIKYVHFERLYNICKLIRILFPPIFTENKYLFSKLYEKHKLKKTAILRKINNYLSPDDISTPLLVDKEDEIIDRVNTIRNKSTIARIIDVFIEIERLGYYANHKWFNELNKSDYARYYRNYYVWWNETAQMSQEVKESICVFSKPFIYIDYLDYFNEISKDEMKMICLHLIENMVYGGITTEYCKIGAMQALNILCSVSTSARENIAWNEYA
jgi:hypothetical protein